MMYDFIGLGIRVESVLPLLLSVGCFLCIVFSFLSFCYDLRDGGAPHTSTRTNICWVTSESRSSVDLLEVMIIGVGMGVCMPTGTCRRMSMGRVG